LPGALLDSHALYWLVSGAKRLSEDALVAIGESQEAGQLYVSAISAWELALAAQKPAHRDPPDLGDGTPKQWFRDAIRATEAKLIPINKTIAMEAAAVVVASGHGDPGDCHLIATSRFKRIPIISRDTVMIGLAAQGFLQIIEC
jgi:PIN domain nuclease of toxin-antitoxin system